MVDLTNNNFDWINSQSENKGLNINATTKI